MNARLLICSRFWSRKYALPQQATVQTTVYDMAFLVEASYSGVVAPHMGLVLEFYAVAPVGDFDACVSLRWLLDNDTKFT